MHAIWNAFGMVTLSKVWGWGQKGFSLKFSYIGMTRMAVCLILAIVSCYPTYYLFRKPDISLHWTFVWPSKSNCIVSMAIVGNEQPSSCLTDWLLTGLIQPSSVYQFAHSATKTDFGTDTTRGTSRLYIIVTLPHLLNAAVHRSGRQCFFRLGAVGFELGTSACNSTKL